MSDVSESPGRAVAAQIPARYRGPGDSVFRVVVTGLASGIILLAAAMAIVIYLEARPTFQAFGIGSFLT